jgi:hypothetical protein
MALSLSSPDQIAPRRAIELLDEFFDIPAAPVELPAFTAHCDLPHVDPDHCPGCRQDLADLLADVTAVWA